MSEVNQSALDALFYTARSHHGFAPTPIDEATLRRLYDLLKWAPTSMNAQPARFVFVTSESAKARLLPALMDGNKPQTLSAPVTVIVAYDTRFFDHLPRLFKAYDAKPMFESNAALAHSTAVRNSSLQGAYLMLAARAIGLDVGAMSGFDEEKINAEFFPDGRFKVNFLCNLGVGVPEKLYPRADRLGFEEACSVV